MSEAGRQVCSTLNLLIYHETLITTDGSVRAWRGLRFNERYAAKLEKQKEKQRQKDLAKAKAAEEAKWTTAPKANPFSVSETVTMMILSLTNLHR